MIAILIGIGIKAPDLRWPARVTELATAARAA